MFSKAAIIFNKGGIIELNAPEGANFLDEMQTSLVQPKISDAWLPYESKTVSHVSNFNANLY
jgi:hypothetical protein